MRILVTGGAGFIGSTFVHRVLASHPGDEVVTLDLLTYAGRRENLADLDNNPRHRFVCGDIANTLIVDALVAEADTIVNFAAETHVDRSLLSSEAFVRSNVAGVLILLEAARLHGRRLIQVSTDEVYGDIEPGRLSVETDSLQPRSPYAAAKAGGELMCQSYFASYGTEVIVTRGCNTVGPRQYPEKLVPLFVTNALQDLSLPMYGDGMQVRDWLHVEDHAAAIDTVLRHGRPGETYNIGAGNECPNIDVVRKILNRLSKPTTLLVYVPDRQGHDRRYALNWTKIRDELGWSPTRTFEETFNQTIDWYVANLNWWQLIRQRGGEFDEYYEKQYRSRLNAAVQSGGV